MITKWIEGFTAETLLDALLRHALSGEGAWVDATHSLHVSLPVQSATTALGALNERVFREDRLLNELEAREATLHELRSQSDALREERDRLLAAAAAAAAASGTDAGVHAAGTLRPRFQARDGSAQADGREACRVPSKKRS